MLHPTKGVQHTKKQTFRQHVVDSQKSYASILCQNLAPPQPQDKAFTFSDKQLIKFIVNVAIQVAQPQVCYANPNQVAIDKKSSLCHRVSEPAKHHLGVDITGISLFDAIGQQRSSAPPASKPKTSLTKNNKKRSHTQLDSRKQVIAFQDRVITINIKEAQHPLK